MNVLDQKFADFFKLSVEEKVECFNREGGPFDMIISQQLNREIIDRIYRVTNSLRKISKSKEGALFLKGLLVHKRAMLYFNQPSSRTFLSFESACHILGMTTSEIRNPNVSSEVKGESMDDALRTFSSYTDLIIMRTKEANSSLRAAWLLNTYSNRPIPVVNGGSGSDQHPTQAILDIYTLQRSMEFDGGLDGKTILMCGDLSRGRTVRSLSYLMKNFEDMKIIYAAPSIFQIGDDILKFLDKHKIPYQLEKENLKRVLPLADAIYMTRIQDEHDQFHGESGKVNMDNFKLKFDDTLKMKKNASVLHPFPRRDEIDVRIDETPYAKYWRQERNGMWTRAALMTIIFKVDQEIIDHDKHNF